MTPAAVRLLWEEPRGEREATWKEMSQLGWLGLSLPEGYGGSALGMVESAILLEEMGRAACPGPYFPTVLAARAIEEAGSDAQKKRWLSPIATGDARATIAFLDADLDWRPDAIQTRAETTAGGWALSGRKQFVPWAHVASVLLVPAKTPDGLTLFLVDPGAAGLTLEPAQMMDPATRLASVTLEGTPEDHALAGSAAKAYVGDAARRVCGEAIQVHGGIGFTWEYDLHLYVKRAKALEAMYGDADYHRELIVRRVAA